MKNSIQQEYLYSTVGTMRPTKTRTCDIANCFAFFVDLYAL